MSKMQFRKEEFEADEINPLLILGIMFAVFIFVGFITLYFGIHIH